MSKELPKDWKWVKMGEIFTIERGGSPRPIEDFVTDDSNGINWIKIGDTKGIVKYIYKTKEKIKPAGASRSRMVYEDDFILSNSMSFGKPFIMKTSGCIHDGWLVIRKNENVDNNFLYYILSSPLVFQQFTKLAKGSTVKNLNIEAVKQVELFIPPKLTQQAIVSKIEELFSEIEKGIESLLTAQQQLKTYRQSVLKWAFEGKLSESGFTRLEDEQDIRQDKKSRKSLYPENPDSDKGELPKGWKWVKLGDVAKKKSIKALPKDYPDAKFIGMDCIEPHTLKPFFLYDFKEFKSAGNYFKKNQVLYGRMRPYLNKVYRAEFDGTCSGEFIILDCGEVFNPDLLKYILHSKAFVSFANRITTGDRPRISYEEISNYDIPLPSINEQINIVQEIESRLSVADKMEESITQSLQQAEALKQSILKKAFEGKLVYKL